MKLKLTIIAAVLAALVAGGVYLLGKRGCAGSGAAPGASAEGTIAEANNRFALDYYTRLTDKEKGNIFFSPYSISTALAMTSEGARGKTAEEIASVFHFPDMDTLRGGNAAAIERINNKKADYTLSTANALWAQKDYSFRKEYFDIVEKYYSGKATNLDFKKDPTGSVETINNWAKERTNGKIPELLDEIDERTRLILTNAVYFKGDWLSPFKKAATRPDDFESAVGTKIKVQMMGQQETFSYAENDLLQVLELPYKGGDLSMLIFLPKKNDLAALEDQLNAAKLSGWKNALAPQRVAVYIPKFKLDTGYDMKQDLQAMGMPTAFQWPGADFSGMDGTKILYIGEVVHKARVEVDEKGTEAAAVTAVSMHAGSAAVTKVPVFRADHPFMFLIQEKSTGNILFMGRVTEPAAPK